MNVMTAIETLTRIEFGLKMLAVIEEHKGKEVMEQDAYEYLGCEFTREEVKYLVELKGVRNGVRDEELEKKILPEFLKDEE